MSTETQNHYEILGVSTKANPRELKRAFITKQRENHPDRNSAPNDFVVRLNAAWQTLSEPVQRIEYDIEMGFRENNLETRQQLHKYRKRHAERVRESQVESANASKQIEAKVYIREGKKKLKDAGLIITKARYGVLTQSRAKRQSLEEFQAEMKDVSTEISTTNDSTAAATDSEIDLWIDVSDACQCMVQHRGRDGGFIEIEDNVDKSRLEGFYDPCPEETAPRHLEVEYMFRRQFHFARVENFEYLVIPNQSHVVDVFKFEQGETPVGEQKSNDDMNVYVRTAMSTRPRSFLQEELEKENVNARLNANDVLEINGKVGFIQRSSLQDLLKYDEVRCAKGRERPNLKLYGKKEMLIVGLHVGLACLIVGRQVESSRCVSWCQSFLSSVMPDR